MDEKSLYILLNINYANSIFQIKKDNSITYNELREESIKYFNIDIKNGDNIEFIYTDGDQEKNILQHDDEDILSAANLIDDNYLLSLDLIIINNQKSNIENKINKNEKQENNIKIILNNEEKKREINKNVLGNKLKQIDFLFINQFYLMQNDISTMINKKYKEIENELTKLSIEINNKKNIEIIMKERVERNNNPYEKNQNQKENKSNKKNENKTKDFKIIDGNDEIIIKKEENNIDYMLIEKSTIPPKQKIKENDDFEFITNFVDTDKLDGSYLFQSNEIKKIKEQKLETIRKNINDLYKNRNYSYNDIKNKGNKIFEIMNRDKEIYRIRVFEINKNIKYYLTEGYKKDLALNEKIKYCNILKYLNHFLEIKNIQTNLDNNLKEEIELEIKNEKYMKKMSRHRKKI